jgi:hypothetical protein
MMSLVIAVAALLVPSTTLASSKVPATINAGPPEEYPFPVIKLLPAKAGQGGAPVALYAGPVRVEGLMVGGSMVDVTTIEPQTVAALRSALVAKNFACGTIRRVVSVLPLPGMGDPYWWVKCQNRHHYAIEEAGPNKKHIVRED